MLFICNSLIIVTNVLHNIAIIISVDDERGSWTVTRYLVLRLPNRFQLEPGEEATVLHYCVSVCSNRCCVARANR